MNWLKRNAVLLGLISLYGFVLGGGIFWLVRAHRHAKREVAALEGKRWERDQLARLSPAPSLANEQRIAAELRAAEQALQTLRASLRGSEADALAPPVFARPLDAYFDFTDFVERTRALATRLHVRLKADERFGFATYAREATSDLMLPTVQRQRIVMQRLVETLLEAGPHELLLVQRERPWRIAPSPADGAAEAAGDFFILDAPLSLRSEGLVQTTAFRLEFTGQTRALRAFLNALAEYRLPLVVRSVEVEPLGAAAESETSGPLPLVRAADAKFTVIVECIEVTPAASGVSL